ncbi:MAG: cytochrome c maturation protein CcmE [bacterium]
MSPARRLAIGITVLAIAMGIIAYNGIRSATVYYLTPTEFTRRPDIQTARVRLAGTVSPGSVRRANGHVAGFTIGDETTSIAVRYDGPLPDLFAEGREVLVEGRLDSDGVMNATQVITTHPTGYKEKNSKP